MGLPRPPFADEYFNGGHPPFRHQFHLFLTQKSWGGIPRLRGAATKKEFDGIVDELVTCGYEILDRSDSTTLLRRRTWGAPDVHLIWAFATFWTLGIGNLAYARFSHINAERVMVKLDTDAPGGPTPPPQPQSDSGSGPEYREPQEASGPTTPPPALPGNTILDAAKELARKAKRYAGSYEFKEVVGKSKAAAAVGDRAMKAARGAMDDKSSPRSDATTSGQITTTSIRDNLVVVALSMMCCFPLGLFFVWTNPRWSRLQKGGWSLLMLPMVMIGSCIQEQKVQEVVQSLVEGDRLWDAGSRDEAADRYRKAWKNHKEMLTSPTASAWVVIRPHLPNLYARLMVYELGKGKRDEARQLSEQAIKDKIELTLETAEARDFHKSHMPITSVADAQSPGRGKGNRIRPGIPPPSSTRAISQTPGITRTAARSSSTGPCPRRRQKSSETSSRDGEISTTIR